MKKKRAQRLPFFDLSNKMVAPGQNALAAMRQGIVDLEQVSNLRLMRSLADAARQSRMLAPDPRGLDPLIFPLEAAMASGDVLQIDLDELERAELWMTALRDMLGRASAQSIQALLDEMVINADIKLQLARINQTTDQAL
ncbi:hypothetical protein HA052_04370 [Chromobacterium haemolyticum]|uniref:Uncharacterized protein n=1 Tax=Chromobacterium fluminis TaxID=3044269 RepID=A0ABX0L7Z4_9NEIS|nr:hypothetical protein [Chromobacterium haemolyticum]NHR04425.1 hypothetical protein [Chromobacterium haemolyticum]